MRIVSNQLLSPTLIGTFSKFYKLRCKKWSSFQSIIVSYVNRNQLQALYPSLELSNFQSIIVSYVNRNVKECDFSIPVQLSESFRKKPTSFQAANRLAQNCGLQSSQHHYCFQSIIVPRLIGAIARS